MFNQTVNGSVESWYGCYTLSDLRDIDVNTVVVNVSISSGYDRVEIESPDEVSVVGSRSVYKISWNFICSSQKIKKSWFPITVIWIDDGEFNGDEAVYFTIINVYFELGFSLTSSPSSESFDDSLLVDIISYMNVTDGEFLSFDIGTCTTSVLFSEGECVFSVTVIYDPIYNKNLTINSTNSYVSGPSGSSSSSMLVHVSGTDTSDLSAFVLHLNDSYWEDADDRIDLSNVTVYITDVGNSYGRDFSGFYFSISPSDPSYFLSLCVSTNEVDEFGTWGRGIVAFAGFPTSEDLIKIKMGSSNDNEFSVSSECLDFNNKLHR